MTSRRVVVVFAALPLAASIAAIMIGHTARRSLQAMRRDWRDLRAGRAVFGGKAMFEE